MNGAVPWWSARWVWRVAVAVTTAAGLGAFLLALVSGSSSLFYAIAAGFWAPFGLVLWYRLPSHPMGPLIAVTGLLSYGIVPAFVMGAYFEQFPAAVTPHAWPVVLGLAAGGSYTYMFLLAILLFPEGRATRTPQRRLAWAVVIAGVIGTFAGLLAEPLGPVRNPIGHFDTARSVYDGTLDLFGYLLLVVILFKVADYRRSHSIRRAQLKWLLYVLAVYFVFTVISFGVIGTEGFNVTGLILDAMFSALIPAAMAVAVLRHRLFEIDRLISRTVTYAIVAMVVALVFAAPVILLPTFLGTQSDLVVAGATLAAAAVFAPVRRGVQDRVDRQFNRSRYDAVREMDDLTGRLASSVDLDPILNEMTGLVGRALQPSTMSLWVRPSA